MPFIRVTRYEDDVVIDISVTKIISFYVAKGGKFTTVELVDNLNIHAKDEPRQLRGYIKKAEGTLPEKAEPNIVSTWVDPVASLERV